MRTIEVNLYNFNELDESAKNKAREWYRNNLEFEPEFVIDDFVKIAEIIGIEFDYQSVPLMGGGTRKKPKIWYSGFYSQGDGACFEGTYSYKSDACEKVREYASKDLELARIADKLNETQTKYNNKITASITHHGRNSHEHSVTIDCSLDENGNELQKEMDSNDEDIVCELMRDLMRWLYDRLEAEYQYQNSNEVIDENIIANEYEFTENGDRY